MIDDEDLGPMRIAAFAFIAALAVAVLAATHRQDRSSTPPPRTPRTNRRPRCLARARAVADG